MGHAIVVDWRGVWWIEGLTGFLRLNLACNLLFGANNLFRLSGPVCGDLGDRSAGGPGDAELLSQLCVDSCEHILVVLQEAAYVFAALTDALALVAVPRTALVDDVVQHR
jgi:hypothetical protein